MTDNDRRADGDAGDLAPGDERAGPGTGSYVLGLVLALLLTSASFGVAPSGLVWGPAIPAALAALAIAQIGIHLVFFLHIATGPDNTNNVLALAFGVLIVFLVIVGSIWIIAHLNHNMIPMSEVMQRMR